MKIQNIVFDFGRVLVDWGQHNLYDKYFGSVEKASWFIANICTKEWHEQTDAGKPFDQAVAELTAEYPEWEEAIAAFRDRWEEMLGSALPGMMQLIEQLKAAGYGVYGLTNWSAETIHHIDYITSKLDGFVVSGVEKVIKPDPRIYKILLERYSLEAQSCVFIDDNQCNLDTADSLGMSTILFKSPEQCRKDLFLMLENEELI